MIQKHRQLIMVSAACFFILLVGFYIRFVRPPTHFISHSIVTIVPGESLNDVTRELRNDGFIRSSVTFQSLAILFGGERKIIAGDYLLAKPENAITLAWRVVHGQFGMVEIKITVPEGFTNQQIGAVLSNKLVVFDEKQFVEDAQDEQGYLFPDTYFFPPTATSSDIISRMKKNFDEKIVPFLPAIATSTHTEADIITMASILEAEATSTTDKRIIAGILWQRIKSGQALQVDSAPDTYKHMGLPVQPIDNPGIASVSAALNPTKTQYNYYLTGDDGVMHYAQTFAQHEANIKKYLK